MAEHTGAMSWTPESTMHTRALIDVRQPMGSMSLSPTNQEVVLGSKMGLYVIQLEHLYTPPRYFAHATAWEVADIQWNPHVCRSEWVASTSNQKLVIWNLNRPSAASVGTEEIRPASHMRMQAQQDVMRSFSFGSASSLMGPRPSITSQTFSMDGSAMRIPAEHRTGLGPPSSTAVEHLLDAHTRAITDINWSPFHPELLASCSVDTWTWVWDLRMAGRGSTRPAQGFSAWNASMTQVKWNRTTLHRIAASCDNKVLVWDDRFGALPLATLETHHSKVYGLDWSPDREKGRDQLMTCSLDGTIKYWDLDSESSRTALSNNARITEPMYTVETPQPVWRARHLPFGHGAMSVAQRGDTAPCMWKYGVDEPVHRFVGHSDIVKEFLFRTKGGADSSHDDREFQLITWSKDQTLRLWPITEEMLSSVGHVHGAPMQQFVIGSDETALPRNAIRSRPIPRMTPAEGEAGSPSSVSSDSHPFTRPSSIRSLPLQSGDASSVEKEMPHSLPAESAHIGGSLSPKPTPERPARSKTTGPQMRYTHEDNNLLALDAVEWMAHIQMGEPSDEDDADLSDTSPSSQPAVDASVLPHEILRVNGRFPDLLESIDIARRRCTVALSGPWHEQGDGTLAYLRVMFTFPPHYPTKPPTIDIERNATIPFKTRADIYRGLMDILETKASQSALSLEPCIEYLLHGRTPETGPSTRDMSQRVLVIPEQQKYSFARTYNHVSDAVVKLMLRSSDNMHSSLVDVDVVKLASRNPLSRTKVTDKTP
ncbi:hypothetical protein MCAP1_003264 [Malassezia caprae]|uniref:RWD, RING finger and WD repeat-containing protein C11E3.05 n=1 Tax=Malassezia caprae TaxID=1381934 RepID=A0AAF0IWN7_9BASI|nr:hypothetical protein MCAP1_003264 [Malassezia caprae]